MILFGYIAAQNRQRQQYMRDCMLLAIPEESELEYSAGSNTDDCTEQLCDLCSPKRALHLQPSG